MGIKNTLEQFSHLKIVCDEPMKKHTGYGVGGCARYYVEPDSLYALNNLITYAKAHRLKHKIIGCGTNVLVSDLGYNGIIINLKRLSDVFFKREEIRAMAGARLEKLVRFACEHSLTGLEALSSIPASVGGAVVMNAGAFGHNISDFITSVETLDNGKIKVYGKEECRFGYRCSRFLGKKEAVISATFKLNEGFFEIINASAKTYAEIRKAMHPTGKSCGSVFKNPKPYTAGELIERAGLKGLSVGGASVSQKHANFIITNGKSKAKDVYCLIGQIKARVQSAFNVQLIEEIEYIGEF